MTRNTVLNEDGISHLVTILDYNWQDELKDYAEHDGDKDYHIFVSLVYLGNLVAGTSYTPEWWVSQEITGEDQAFIIAEQENNE